MIQRRYIQFIIILSVIFVIGVAYAQINPEPLETIHQNAGITCENCHGTDAGGTEVKKEKCFECHFGDYNNLANNSSIHFLPMNSHWSNGPAECTDCHHVHHEQEMVCNRCHN